MGRLFGTDGVRGIANRELTPELAFKLGKAGTFILKKENKRPIMIIGKDTRVSGDMLENALTAGMDFSIQITTGAPGAVYPASAEPTARLHSSNCA